jgi:hypothetical protein
MIMTYVKLVAELREDIFLAYREDLLGTADQYGIDEDEALNSTIDELIEKSVAIELENMYK